MERMNDKIAFVIEENKETENGFQEKKHKIYYSCWSNYKSTSGKEFYENETTNAKITATFKVRYCRAIKDIDSTTHKIIFRGKVYDIIYVKDDDPYFWYFKCTSVNGGI